MSGTEHGEATSTVDGGDSRGGGTTSILRERLTLAQVLELVGYGPDELLSVLVIRPGQSEPDRRTGLYRPAELVTMAQGLTDVNVWHSLSTFRPGTTGRGGAADVARIPCLWADLDVVAADPRLKALGIPTWDLARALIEDLSEILGTLPAWVTMTGHGLQPVWLLDPEESTDVPLVAHMLRRFGMLVKHIARLRGCHVDSVWDSPRVLRAADSVNLKDPARPIPAVAWATGGAPVGLVELAEILEAYNVPNRVEDPAAEPVPVASWEWAERTCGYVLGMISGWPTDTPGARHPWLMGALVRLAAAHRAGCLSESGWHGALVELEDRMRVLCAPDPTAMGEERRAQEERAARVGDEIYNERHGGIAWALTRVESMGEHELAGQFGKCRLCKSRRQVRAWEADLEAQEVAR